MTDKKERSNQFVKKIRIGFNPGPFPSIYITCNPFLFNINVLFSLHGLGGDGDRCELGKADEVSHAGRAAQYGVQHLHNI